MKKFQKPKKRKLSIVNFQFSILMSAVIMLAGCEKKDPGTYDSLLNTNVESIIFETDQAASQSFSITSSKTWSASVVSGAEWCSVSPTSGNGDATVTVNVAKCTSDSNRQAVINVTVGTLVRAITVTQPFVLNTVNAAFESAAAGSTSVSITTGMPWSVSVASGADWCTVSPASGDGSGTITLNATEQTKILNRQAIITITVGGLYSKTITATQPRMFPNISNGRRVLINRGLQIQGLVFSSTTPQKPTNYNLWKSTNFTALSSWHDTDAEKTLGWSGLKWSRWIRETTDSKYNPLTTNEIALKANLVSLQYADERNQDTYPGTAGTFSADILKDFKDVFANLHSTMGMDFLACTNFGANDASTSPGGESKRMTLAGLQNYLKETGADMIMFDAYPINYAPSLGRKVSYSWWYAETQKYRIAGLAGADGSGKEPVPYSQYLDLYRADYNGGYSGPLPAESFVRMQQFVCWAFGYTFLNAFIYNKNNGTAVYPTMFESDGDSKPTATFSHVAEANRQSLNLGPALVRLMSSDLRMIPGKGSDTFGGTLPAEMKIDAWTRGAGGNDYIVSITPVTSAGGDASSTYNDVVIGYFEPLRSDNSDYPFADGTHFMIVNAARTGTAAEKAQTYRIVFDFGTSGFNSLQRLSRNTGQVEEVPLTLISGTQYSLDLSLEGGTGDLFRFWTSSPAVQ